jgi:hypothetical protein
VQTYLVRYGIMGDVARFSCVAGSDTTFDRGAVVVIQSHRGLELGEVLFAARDCNGSTGLGSELGAEAGDHARSLGTERPHVLRLAGALDLERSRQAQEARASRFAECKRVLDQGDWPWELVDVEPLLDGRSTVIHYLGPHRLDATPWRARFRVECDFDVLLEPIGPDVDDQAFDESGEDTAGEGGCGNCGCGAGAEEMGGGVTSADDEHDRQDADGCRTGGHAGCSSCGISQMLAARGRARTLDQSPAPDLTSV